MTPVVSKMLTHLIHILHSCTFDITNETLIVGIEKLQLFAGRRVDKFSVDKKLSTKRNVHLVDVQLNGLEDQLLFAGTAAANSDDLKSNVFYLSMCLPKI